MRGGGLKFLMLSLRRISSLTSTNRMSVTIKWERGKNQLMEEDIRTDSPRHYQPFDVIFRLIKKAGFDFQ